MAVRVRVPTPLRRFTAGVDEVTAEGDSIKAVLDDLERRHPGMRERLLDAIDGELVPGDRQRRQRGDGVGP